MDPLSVTSGVAGIITLAGSAYQAIATYIGHVKNAAAEVQNLATEVRNLYGILSNLSLLASSLEKDHLPTTLKHSYLNACHKTLYKIDIRVNMAVSDFKAGSRLDMIKRRLRWPFSVGETLELLEEMTRHKDNISLALSADSATRLMEVLSVQKELGCSVNGISGAVQELQEAVETRIEIEVRTAIDKKRQQVVNFFQAVNPQPKFETSMDLRQDMTGLWLVEGTKFRQWKTQPNARIWLSGIPGSGKTVLCGAVIQDVLQLSSPTTAAAFFFCDYAVPESQLPVQIVGSLAVQLALQKPEAFAILEEHYHELHPPSGLVKSPRLGRLVDLIRELAACFDQVFVVIDALDECGKNTVDVAEALKGIADRCCNVSMAMFSRDEEHIRRILEDDFSNIEIAANRDDLSLYLATQMAKRHKFSSMLLRQPDLYNDIRQSLLEGAQGMFRWVACQLDYLESLPSNRQRRKALTKLPPSLFQTYQRILDAAFDEDSNDETRELIQRTLHWIAVSSPPLTIPQLCEAVSLHEDEDDLDEDDIVDEFEIAQACSSLIRKTHDGNGYEFAHFTVREFLETLSTSSRLAPFRLDSELATQSLAVASLRYLLLDKFGYIRPPSDISDLAEGSGSCPFYQHAMSRWVFYAQKHFTNPIILSLASQLFDPAKTAHFRNFASAVVLYVLGLHTSSEKTKVLDVSASDTSTLHLAAALGLRDVCASLIDNGSDVGIQSHQLGFPLDAAISGMWSMSLKSSLPFRSIDGSRRTETVNLLLNNGASCTVKWTKIDELSLFSPLHEFQCLGDAGLCTKILNHTIFGREFISNFAVCLLKESKDSQFAKKLVQSICGLSEGGVSLTGQFRELTKEIKKKQIVRPVEYCRIAAVEVGLQSSSTELSADLLVEATVKDDIESLLALLSLQPELCHEIRLERGRTLLHLAAEKGCLNSAKVLLDSGFPIHSVDKQGETALHKCCADDKAHIAKLLLMNGADPSAETNNGRTLWHKAAVKGAISVLDILIHMDDLDSALRKKDNEGITPIVAASHANAVRTGAFLAENSECLPDYFQGCNTDSVLRPDATDIFDVLEAKGAMDACVPLGGPSPLHAVEMCTVPEWVERLLPFMDAEQLFEGKYPIEFTITKFWSTHFVLPGVDSLFKSRTFLALLTPKIIQELWPDGHTLWEHLCLHPTGLYGGVEQVLYYAKISGFYRMLASAVDAGAADAFEERRPGVSGITPLLPVFYLLQEGGKYGGGLKTKHWLYDEPIEEEYAAKALLHILHRSKGPVSTVHLCPESEHTFDIIYTAVENGKLPSLGLLTDYVFGTRLATHGSGEKGMANSLSYIMHMALPANLFNTMMKKVRMPDLAACDIAVFADICHTLVTNDNDSVYRYHGLLDLAKKEDKTLCFPASLVSQVQWPIANSEMFDWRQTFTMEYSFLKPSRFTGCNVMHAAALLGWTFLLDFCLQNHLFDVDTTSDGDKLTPLLCAAINRRASTARYLISWGADASQCSVQGWLPHSFAKEGDDLWEALEFYKRYEINGNVSVAMRLAGLDQLTSSEDELANERNRIELDANFCDMPKTATLTAVCD